MLKNKKWLAALLIAAIFTGSYFDHKGRARKRNYSDFHCFYLAGQRMLNQQDIYVVNDKTAAEFRYAPVFALIMSGLARVKEDTADTIWYTSNFLLLIACFLLIKAMVKPAGLERKAAAWMYALFGLGMIRQVIHNLSAGQTNILIMFSALLGLYLISKKRDLAGAAALAFSITIKYTPLIFIPYFILKKKFKIGLLLMFFLAVYLFLPGLFIGFKTNLHYLKGLLPFLSNSTILDPLTILDPKNQSLFSTAHRYFTNCLAYFHSGQMPFQNFGLSQSKINLIFIGLSSLIYLLIFYAPKRKNQGGAPKREIIDYALLLICVIIFNLNAWMHNYILLSLGYFIVLYHLAKSNFQDRVVLALFAFSYALSVVNLAGLLGKVISYKFLFYSPFTLSALFIYAALLRIKLTRSIDTG